MRSSELIILILLSSNALYAQDFRELINKATEAYWNSSYTESGRYYDQAFELNYDSLGLDNDFYQAACVWSLLKDKQKALDYLALAYKYGYGNLEEIKSNTDLDYIRHDARYNAIISDSVITADRIISDLMERDYVSYDSKILDMRKFNNPLLPFINSLNISIDSTKVKIDSLIDFSTKTLSFS